MFLAIWCGIGAMSAPKVEAAIKAILSNDEVWIGAKYYPDPAVAVSTAMNADIKNMYGNKTVASISSILRSFLSEPALWSEPVTDVSGAHPFIFFHQRKAGGSSIRQALWASARGHDLTTYIPCKDMHCDTYTLPKLIPPQHHHHQRRKHTKHKKVKSTWYDGTRKAVYAGHFPWGEPQNKFELYDATSLQGNKTSTAFSCATNYRSPIPRIASCLYMRHEEKMKGNCVSDMDSVTLEYLLREPDRCVCFHTPEYSLCACVRAMCTRCSPDHALRMSMCMLTPISYILSMPRLRRHSPLVPYTRLVWFGCAVQVRKLLLERTVPNNVRDSSRLFC